jgi:hypothetical protein
MPLPLIETSQAPVAKQKAVNLQLTTAAQTLVECPAYTVPLLGFNAGDRTARGVVEFSSPLLVTNISGSPANFTVRVNRVNPVANSVSTFIIGNQFVVEPNDIAIFPLNGQFLLREPNADENLGGDYLDISASANNALVATVSYTEGQAEENDVG